MRPNLLRIIYLIINCMLVFQLEACATQQEGTEESLENVSESKSSADTASADDNLSEKNQAALAEASSNDFTDPKQVQLTDTEEKLEAAPEAPPADPSASATHEETPDLLNETGSPTPTANIESLSVLLFAKSSTRLNMEYKNQLKELAKQLKSNRQLKIIVSGHSDSRGAAAFNRHLALKRAKAVQAFMLKLGVKKSQITVESFGKEQLRAVGESEQEHAQNRRVEITLR